MELIRIHGEPQNVITHDNRNPSISFAQHDGIEFVLLGEVVLKIWITGTEIRLERKQIGIGSTREEIINAYDAENSNPFRFAGMYWDAHTGTYYTPNRHFNPRTGRWTQPDHSFGVQQISLLAQWKQRIYLFS